MTLEDRLHAVLNQVFTTSDFCLTRGEVLPELRIAYETYGTLNANRDNTVLLCHGYTSNHHMVGPPGATLAEGFVEPSASE
ncbi:MAG: hypothetical protein R3C09_28940 [Pirellulaceae bacterium]